MRGEAGAAAMAGREGPGTRSYRYYDLIMAGFVAVLIVSNLVAAGKPVRVGGLTFGSGVLFFPISYLIGDVLTEVYGYARSRRVVWAGFGALGFASAMSWLVLRLPPAPGWPGQGAFEAVFGNAPRVVLASMVAFAVGEFLNAYALARMKVQTRGRFLWARTIGSTVIGEAADSAIFWSIAFVGIWPTGQLFEVMATSYAMKVGWEVAATPLTYAIVGFLKRAEAEDHYDIGTNFTPFSIRA